MSGEFPYLPYFALYIVSASLLSSDSRGATHWKLNEVEGVVRASDGNDILKSDPILSILTKGNPPKVAPSKKTSCEHCTKSRSHGSRYSKTITMMDVMSVDHIEQLFKL